MLLRITKLYLPTFQPSKQADLRLGLGTTAAHLPLIFDSCVLTIKVGCRRQEPPEGGGGAFRAIDLSVLSSRYRELLSARQLTAYTDQVDNLTASGTSPTILLIFEIRTLLLIAHRLTSLTHGSFD